MIDFLFFFSSRRRHTRLTCDWSSDVCSSDLIDIAGEATIVKSADPGRCRGFYDGRLPGDIDDLVHALAVGEAENLAVPIGKRAVIDDRFRTHRLEPLGLFVRRGNRQDACPEHPGDLEPEHRDAARALN